MTYPAGYEWLGRIGTLPKMVTEALKTVGVVETPGAGNNPTIMSWAKEVGVAVEYTGDNVPWCGLLLALVAKRAGYEAPKHPLWALNWRGFGSEEHQPVLGDVLVFIRPQGGHVGLYLGEDQTAYAVLGGNTRDSVSIGWIEKIRLRAVRAPLYKIGRPASSKPYLLTRSGKLSRNEA